MKIFLRCLRMYPKESLLAPLFKLLEACFDLCVPLVVAAIIDRGIATGNTSLVWQLCGVLVLLAFRVTGVYTLTTPPTALVLLRLLLYPAGLTALNLLMLRLVRKWVE